MILFPFERIESVPNGRGGVSDLSKEDEFIDVADKFILKSVRGVRQPHYSGIAAFMFEAQIKIDFDEHYNLSDVEFRIAAQETMLKELSLELDGVNLLETSLSGVSETLRKMKISTNEIDVGLEAREIGLSFFPMILKVA